MATAPFSKTSRSCALLSSWRHDGQDRQDKQTTKFTTPRLGSARKNVLRKLLRIPYRRLTAGFSVCWLCLFVAGVLSEMHEVRTFAPCKAFLFDTFAFFSSLENYFGFRTTNVKGKTDHSVSLRWNKRFWTFLKSRVFFWLCIRLIYELISPGWIKTRWYSQCVFCY